MPNELTDEQAKELEKMVKDVDIEELSMALWEIRERNKINRQTEDGAQ